MKMVKSLLLGSAAGLVAVVGAQAADLPVKAKAVEYVKVCSVYGAGFYYIPGTDTCLKVGGWIQTDWNFGAGSTDFWYGYNTAGSRFNREDTQNVNVRNRAYVTLDARTQTEYGVLRAYIRNGWEFNSAQADYRGLPLFDAAFIQFAGFTVGRTRTFFDFYVGSLSYAPLSGANGNPWVNVIGYTAQFGGGFTATLAVEDATQHRGTIWDATANPLQVIGAGAFTVTGTGPTGWGNYGGQDWPDVVANLRVDQPWGSAQISGAVHHLKAGYYCGAAGNAAGVQCGAVGGGVSGVPENGHPDERVGFAVLGGLKLNLPWAKGDEFWVQAAYADGASNYLGSHAYFATNQVGMIKGRTAAFGMPFDAVFRGNPVGGAGADPLSQVETVKGWSIMAGVQHNWSAKLVSSVFGSYLQYDYGAAATDIFCNSRASRAGGTAATTIASVPAGCNPDFAIWHVGTRTIWRPVTNLDIGLEVLYTRLDQNMTGNWLLNQTGGISGGAYAASDQEQWSGTIRFQRNFWP